MVQQLIDYWYQMEFFSPCWPVREKEDLNLLKKALPWPEQPTPDIRVSYDVYLGKAIVYPLICWILERLGLREEDVPVERDQTPLCLCALKVDQEGVYVPESFSVSSFVWALGCMEKAADFNVNLVSAALAKLQVQFDETLIEMDAAVTAETLVQLFGAVCRELCVDPALFKAELWARRKVQRRKKDGTFPPLEPSTEMLQSFYLKDLDRVKQAPGAAVQNFAEALLDKHPDRVRIDADVHAMQAWLAAERFPRGVWPSAYSPSLMQQLAVNIAESGPELFSVNGPPGTGKTTLLKEVVASNVIQRAELMCRYKRPDDAFTAAKFKNPPDPYNQTYYIPDRSLTAYGILVASNNNAAVENISVELPKAIGRDRTGHFSHALDRMEESYFSDVASALLKEPAWGLISARLGKKSNLNQLKEQLWWADTATLRAYYDDPPDWEAARRNFRAAWQAVEGARKEIARAQRSLEKLRTAQAELKAFGLTREEAERALQEADRDMAEAVERRLKLEIRQNVQRQNAEALKASLPPMKRLLPGLFSRNPIVQEWKFAEREYEDVTAELARQNAAVPDLEDKRRAAEQRLAEWEQGRRAAERTCAERRRAVEEQRERFGDSFADAAFWENIQENEKSQSSCPWTEQSYDALREELFYQALMLQKAFVLNSNAVKQNLQRLFGMWDGKFMAVEREAAYGSLLNTLFFVVPVVSTTFASVQSFLEGIGPQELGLLIVDEAGQATPQSALGALWRTRRAVIVGDPLQVEPIVTVPRELQRRFAEENKLPPCYRIPELSVQLLADARNPYGGQQEQMGERLWLGCPLVIHRRCVEPMFSVSNRIAYDGRMFCKTAQPEEGRPFLLERSAWFDVGGTEKGGKNHTVPAQIELTARLVEGAARRRGGLPDLYLITPFKSVANSLHARLRAALRIALPALEADAIETWLNASCGTVHTFQGKEAAEVLLVLGCDSEQGKSAAQWVGQKPNIINVAASRAKYRLGVIGEFALWREIPYVETLCRLLQDNVIANL